MMHGCYGRRLPAGSSDAALTGGAGSYDIGSDPAVAAAQGLAAKIRAQAQATALAKRVQAAIEYGDPSGVEGLTAEQQKASSENPFSVLKNLSHSHDVGLQGLEEDLNKSNLFYSGYRGQQLGEADRAYQGQRYQAGTQFRGLSSDINDALANALMQADQYEASAIGSSDGGGYDYGSGEAQPASTGYSSLINALRGPTAPRTGTPVLNYGVSAPPKPPAVKNTYPSAFVNIRSRKGI